MCLFHRDIEPTQIRFCDTSPCTINNGMSSQIVPFKSRKAVRLHYTTSGPLYDTPSELLYDTPSESLYDTPRESLYPATPTDKPTDKMQPMAPMRTNKAVTSSSSPDGWCSSGSEHSPSSASSFRPSKKTKRVLLWGTAGGDDGYGDIMSDV
jgi:hypothetical protein